MTDNSIPEQILRLKTIFADSPTYKNLETEFHRLLEQRQAEISAGLVNEARGIALIGASGSGKTTAIKRLLGSLKFQKDHETDKRGEVLSFPVPSPATLKFVGQTALQTLGYPLRRDKTSQIIWDMVKDHLRSHEILFLHLDEAQDLSAHQTPREKQSVINTLKSLMQNQQWPVGMILSGMPELKDMLNHDPQLARRFYPIAFPSLNAINDSNQVVSTVKYYAKQAKLNVCENLCNSEFAARHIHAADGEFGLMIELTILSIEDALRKQSINLTINNFSSAFRRRSGCLDALNPFIANDFERLNCRQLLNGSEYHG